MSELHLLPAAWVKIQREIEQHDRQLTILNDALELIQQVGASDAVIEGLLTAIDALEERHESEEIIEPDDSEAGVRQEVISRLRGEGYRGAGFEILVTEYHRDLADQEWAKAENEVRGQMIRPEYRASDYSPRRLWFCNSRELRKYASEDLMRWFDQNGRLTRAQLRDNLLGRRHYVGSEVLAA